MALNLEEPVALIDPLVEPTSSRAGVLVDSEVPEGINLKPGIERERADVPTLADMSHLG